MRSTLSGWEVELARWLKPFLDRLGHKARRRMCPLYVTGLIGPGDRKSVQPMAARLAPYASTKCGAPVGADVVKSPAGAYRWRNEASACEQL